MYSGWIKPFPVDRELSDGERSTVLADGMGESCVPFTYSSVIRFDSICTDFIDRRFRLRGMFVTLLTCVAAIGMLLFGLFFLSYLVLPSFLQGRIDGGTAVIAGVVIGATSFGFPVLFWRFILSKDLFAYTHYPIRFNRKTQKVHVFRHNGPGGVLTVPFDEVFWHIGRGLRDKYLCDVRGHVLEGTEVKDTFALGHYFDDTRLDRIYSVWEFIRRYMEEGPEAVAEHPLDRVIDLSMKPTWTNCYLWVAASMGMTMLRLRFVLFFIYYPLVGLLTIVRWLVLNSCKTPRWPPEIEAECRTPQDDPHRWEEPRYHWEFANRPGVMARERERERRQQQHCR